MTQEQWDATVKAATPKGERMTFKPAKLVISSELYADWKKKGYIRDDGSFDWEKIPNHLSKELKAL